jgi:hypothetical protein
MWSEVTDIDSHFRHVAQCWQFVHKMADSAGRRIEQVLHVLSDTDGAVMLSGGWRDTYKVFEGTAEGKRGIGRPRWKCEDYIKVDNKKMGGRT